VQQANLDREMKQLASFDQELQAIEKEKSQADARINECALEVKKLQHAIEAVTREKDSATRMMSDLMAKHPWIKEQRQYFGQPNTAFDFAQNDPTDARNKLKRLEEMNTQLKKNVNEKVIELLDR
jgi:structural maintenance of chromosome 2